jgi:hypothetical protein
MNYTKGTMMSTINLSSIDKGRHYLEVLDSRSFVIDEKAPKGN